MAKRPSRVQASSSWRHRENAGAAGSKNASRWTFTFLALGLIGFLIWWFWPRPTLDAHLVSIYVSKHDKLKYPPLAYVAEDAELLSKVTGGKGKDWSSLDNASSLRTLGGKLKALALDDSEVLVLHLGMHGVSQAGQPVLLCSDFLRRGDSGTYPLKELLQNVSESRAGLKLIVLESGRLGSDPRLGFVVNEFPRLLEREIKEINDSRLFVLNSNAPLQTTTVSHDLQQSIFAHLVARGLVGFADDDGDYRLTLKELYTYVANYSVDWFPLGQGGEQTPPLFQGGKGYVRHADLPDGKLVVVNLATHWKDRWQSDDKDQEPAEKPAESPEKKEPSSTARWSPPAERTRSLGPGVTLAVFRSPLGAATSSSRVLAQAEPAKDPDSAPPKAGGADEKPPLAKTGPGGEKGPAAERPSSEPTSPAPGDAPKKADESPKPKEDPKKKSPQEELTAELLADLEKGWRLRDEIQGIDFDTLSRSAQVGFSPADYAPHLWRELNALLLDFEQRVRAGAAYNPAVLRDDLRDFIGELEEFKRCIANPSRTPRGLKNSSVTDRLVEAWRTFHASPEAESFRRGQADLAAVIDTVRLRNDLVLLAPYYVAWYHRMSMSSSNDIDPMRQIPGLLADLKSLQSRLEVWRSSEIDPRRVESVAKSRSELAQTAGEIHRLLAVLESESLGGADAIGGQTPLTPLGERRVADQLSTPLLPAPRRMRLVRALLERGCKPPEPEESYAVRDGKFTGINVARRQWTRLRDRADLEIALVGLVDAGRAEKLRTQLDDSGASRTADDDKLWEAYAQLGTGLQDFYRSLPSRTRSAESGADPAALARLVDARDAREVPPRANVFSRFEFRLKEPDPKLTIVVPLEGVDLDQRRDVPVKVTIQGANSKVAKARLTLQFSPRLLSVRLQDNSAPFTPGVAQEIPLGSGRRFSKELTFLVRALTDREQADEAPRIEIDISSKATQPAGDAPLARDFKRLDCNLPNPNRIDLIVRRPGVNEKSSTLKVLKPFPNRRTEYQFGLKNLSDRPKKVTVQLVRVPAPRDLRWRPGLLQVKGRYPSQAEVFDERMRVRPEIKVLATTSAPIELLATQDEIFLNLQPPGAGEKKADEKKPGDMSAEKKVEPADITYGMAFVIREVEQPDQPQIKWIEVRPMRPSQYLTASVRYDEQQQRILVGFEPTITPAREYWGRAKPKPNPITVRMSSPSKFDRGANLEARFLEPADFSGGSQLYAVVPPDTVDPRRIVSLDVDGYPRAFVFEVECNGSQVGKRLRPDRKRARVLALNVPARPEFYYREADESDVRPMVEGQEKRKGAALQGNRPAAIKTAPFGADQCRELMCYLQIDAPFDAFDSGGDDVITVRLSETSEVKRLYDDRHATTSLTVSKSGSLLVDSEVRDHQVTLNTSGKVDLESNVIARLDFRGQSYEDRFPIVLDAREPEILAFRTLPGISDRLKIGVPLRIELELRDQSGIEKVEFGFDKGPAANGELDDAEIIDPPKIVSGQAGISTQVVYTVPTMELKPGDHRLLIRVTDRAGHQTMVGPPRAPRRMLLAMYKPAPPMMNPGGTSNGSGEMKKLLIKGKVVLPSFGVSESKLTLSKVVGDKAQPIKTIDSIHKKPDFVFEDLKPGQYNVEVEAVIRNSRKTFGPKNVEPWPEDEKKSLTIKP